MSASLVLAGLTFSDSNAGLDEIEEDEDRMEDLDLSQPSAILDGDEVVDEEAEEEEAEPSLWQLLSSLRLVPKQVYSLWLMQLFFYNVTMMVSFWWPTYVGIEIFGGHPGDEGSGSTRFQQVFSVCAVWSMWPSIVFLWPLVRCPLIPLWALGPLSTPPFV